MEILWQVPCGSLEDDGPVLSWDVNTTYTFRSEWENAGGGSTTANNPAASSAAAAPASVGRTRTTEVDIPTSHRSNRRNQVDDTRRRDSSLRRLSWIWLAKRLRL